MRWEVPGWVIEQDGSRYTCKSTDETSFFTGLVVDRISTNPTTYIFMIRVRDPLQLSRVRESLMQLNLPVDPVLNEDGVPIVDPEHLCYVRGIADVDVSRIFAQLCTFQPNLLPVAQYISVWRMMQALLLLGNLSRAHQPQPLYATGTLAPQTFFSGAATPQGPGVSVQPSPHPQPAGQRTITLTPEDVEFAEKKGWIYQNSNRLLLMTNPAYFATAQNQTRHERYILLNLADNYEFTSRPSLRGQGIFTLDLVNDDVLKAEIEQFVRDPKGYREAEQNRTSLGMRKK